MIEDTTPGVVSRSRIVEVDVATDAAGRPACTVKYRRHDGVVGRRQVDANEWPAEFWPPQVGDVVAVVVAPAVAFEERLGDSGEPEPEAVVRMRERMRQLEGERRGASSMKGGLSDG